jgi:hypothetical protein
MNLPSYFNVRSWPGLKTWVISVCGSLAVFEFLGWFAWHDVNGRFLDITTALIIIPSATCMMLGVIAAIWYYAARIPFVASLAWMAKLLPLTWAVPLFDLLQTGGAGAVFTTPFVDGNGFVFSIITGGLFPFSSGLSVGGHFAMLALTVCVGLIPWSITRDWKRTALAALLYSAAQTTLVYLASVLGLWHRIVYLKGWSGDMSDVSRSVLAAINRGYWWTNLYERFPTSIDQQAVISLRLTIAGILVLALGAILIIVAYRAIPNWQRLARHLFASRTMTDHVAYVVVGLLFGGLMNGGATLHGTWWYALVLLVLLAAALRVISVLRRDLQFLSRDEAAGTDQPIARGELKTDRALELIQVSQWYAVLVAWVLGWPILGFTFVYLAASHLSRDRAWLTWPWMGSVYRAMGAASLALIGLLFGAQTARLSLFVLLIAILAAAHRLFMEMVWGRRQSS